MGMYEYSKKEKYAYLHQAKLYENLVLAIPSQSQFKKNISFYFQLPEKPADFRDIKKHFEQKKFLLILKKRKQKNKKN